MEGEFFALVEDLIRRPGFEVARGRIVFSLFCSALLCFLFFLVLFTTKTL
jgi:membrane-associated protease RseP (regulator of RpoE activity)